MANVINATSTGNGGLVSTGDDSGILNIQTNETTAITVNASQQVGVGATPSAQLQVFCQDSVSGKAIRAAYDGTYYSDYTENAINCYNNNYNINVKSGSNLIFKTADTERMRIDSSGNLCINSTSVVGAEKLGVKFDGSTINGIGVQTTASSSGDGFVVFRNSAGTAIGTISRVSTTNAVAYNTTSDQRLKSNIENAKPVLDKLMQVQVRQYDWTEGSTHQDYGFIAQELEPTLSGVVTRGKTDEDMWQLDYAKLTPHLVKAIQELKAINDTQAETINALTARVVALESK